VMQNYEAKKPSYFATPSPQLVRALHTSLTRILEQPLSRRFALHKAASQKFKNAVEVLGLRQLASEPANQANGMTAIFLPDGIKNTDLLPKVLENDVVFAGGLHKEITSKYFRVGHMGSSVVCSLNLFYIGSAFRVTDCVRR
jgi:alanine-glyoxylate transaminase/serine-glyoxylate transaminase/serine-pyruvate transaminase